MVGSVRLFKAVEGRDEMWVLVHDYIGLREPRREPHPESPWPLTQKHDAIVAGQDWARRLGVEFLQFDSYEQTS